MTQPDECPAAPVQESGEVIRCSVATVQTGAKYIRMVDQCSRCCWIDPASLDRWALQAHAEMMDGLSQRVSLASNMHPFAFVQQGGIDLLLPEAISQAMAAAATAWEYPERAGKYDAVRARQIGLQLYLYIQEQNQR